MANCNKYRKKMFKFKSYSVSKAEKKSETGKSNSPSSSSSSTGTLKKTTGATSSSTNSATRQYVSPKTKTKATANEIKTLNNYRPVEYSSKIYPKKTVTKWSENKTFSNKKETEKVVIPSPKKKLERK